MYCCNKGSSQGHPAENVVHISGYIPQYLEFVQAVTNFGMGSTDAKTGELESNSSADSIVSEDDLSISSHDLPGNQHGLGLAVDSASATVSHHSWVSQDKAGSNAAVARRHCTPIRNCSSCSSSFTAQHHDGIDSTPFWNAVPVPQQQHQHSHRQGIAQPWQSNVVQRSSYLPSNAPSQPCSGFSPRSFDSQTAHCGWAISPTAYSNELEDSTSDIVTEAAFVMSEVGMTFSAAAHVNSCFSFLRVI